VLSVRDELRAVARRPVHPALQSLCVRLRPRHNEDVNLRLGTPCAADVSRHEGLPCCGRPEREGHPPDEGGGIQGPLYFTLCGAGRSRVAPPRVLQHIQVNALVTPFGRHGQRSRQLNLRAAR